LLLSLLCLIPFPPQNWKNLEFSLLSCDFAYVTWDWALEMRKTLTRNKRRFKWKSTKGDIFKFWRSIELTFWMVWAWVIPYLLSKFQLNLM
jgi:hypothetical protein